MRRLIRVSVQRHGGFPVNSFAQMHGVAGQKDVAIGECYHQRAFAGRVARSEQELQAAISKEIEVVSEFQPVVAARRQVVLEHEYPAPVGIGPVGVAQLVGSDDKLCFRKVAESADVIEMAMRDDYILDV